jgi:hypothetical protein
MKTLFDHTFYFVLLIVAAYAGYFINKHRSWFTTRGAFAVTMFGAILTWGFYAGFSFGHPDGAFVLSFGAGAWLVRVNPYYVALLLKPFGWMFALLRRITQLIAAPFRARAQSDQQTHPTSSFLLVLLHTAETFFSDMEQLFAKYAERHAQYHAEAHDSARTG